MCWSIYTLLSNNYWCHSWFWSPYQDLFSNSASRSRLLSLLARLNSHLRRDWSRHVKLISSWFLQPEMLEGDNRNWSSNHHQSVRHHLYYFNKFSSYRYNTYIIYNNILDLMESLSKRCSRRFVFYSFLSYVRMYVVIRSSHPPSVFTVLEYIVRCISILPKIKMN